MKNSFFTYLSYFILLNTFIAILIGYWFIFTHLLIEQSSDKVELLNMSKAKVFRVYTCKCNRFLCYLESSGFINAGCRVKSIYTIK